MKAVPVSEGILVIDDDAVYGEYLRDILTENGYSVTLVSSGDEGLARVASAVPGIVLLDKSMPGMDGYTLCRRLRATRETAELPIIILTAYDSTADRIEGLRAGAHDFISKAYTPELLLARVRSIAQLVEVRRQVEELRRTLTRTLVHELRNPLSVIVGYSTLLASENGNEKDQAILNTIAGQAQRMSDIVDEVLMDRTVSDCALAPDRTTVDLREIASEIVVEQSILAARKRMQIELLDGPIASANVDAKLVKNALRNLISNAVKYAGQDVRIEVRAERRGGCASLSVRPPDIRLAVKATLLGHGWQISA